MIIHDPQRLRELIDEIAEWTLEQRRQYIADLGNAFGSKAAEQIKQGLTDLWAERKKHVEVSNERTFRDVTDHRKSHP